MSEAIITKDMTIGDVVQKYPHVADTLMANGVHCVGCGARFFETLEMGFKGHGMDDTQVDKIINELNAAAKENPVEGEIIAVTEKAGAKLKEILKSESKEGNYLRFQVISKEEGFNYGLDIVKEKKDDDTVIEAHGIKIIVDKESIPLAKGARIDYVDGENAGFRISTKNSGGCCST